MINIMHCLINSIQETGAGGDCLFSSIAWGLNLCGMCRLNKDPKINGGKPLLWDAAVGTFHII